MNLSAAVQAFEAEFLTVRDGPDDYFAPPGIPYDTVMVAGETSTEAAAAWLAAARRAAGAPRQMLWWGKRPELSVIPAKARERQRFRVLGRFLATSRTD
jgi:hypothetical protein